MVGLSDQQHFITTHRLYCTFIVFLTPPPPPSIERHRCSVHGAHPHPHPHPMSLADGKLCRFDIVYDGIAAVYGLNRRSLMAGNQI